MAITDFIYILRVAPDGFETGGADHAHIWSHSACPGYVLTGEGEVSTPGQPPTRSVPMKVVVGFYEEWPDGNITHRTTLFKREKFRVPLHPQQFDMVAAMLDWLRAGRQTLTITLAYRNGWWTCWLDTRGQPPTVASVTRAGGSGPIAPGDYRLDTARWSAETINEHDGDRLILGTQFRAAAPDPAAGRHGAQFGEGYFHFDYLDQRDVRVTAREEQFGLLNVTVNMPPSYESRIRAGFVAFDPQTNPIRLDLHVNDDATSGRVTFQTGQGTFGPWTYPASRPGR